MACKQAALLTLGRIGMFRAVQALPGPCSNSKVTGPLGPMQGVTLRRQLCKGPPEFVAKNRHPSYSTPYHPITLYAHRPLQCAWPSVVLPS